MNDLEKYRLEINQITEEIMQLLLKRLDLSIDIAKYKQAHGLEIFVPEREAELIQKMVLEKYPEESQMLLETLISLSKKVQKETIE